MWQVGQRPKHAPTGVKGRDADDAVVFSSESIIALQIGTCILLSNRISRYPSAPEELSRFEKYA